MYGTVGSIDPKVTRQRQTIDHHSGNVHCHRQVLGYDYPIYMARMMFYHLPFLWYPGMNRSNSTVDACLSLQVRENTWDVDRHRERLLTWVSACWRAASCWEARCSCCSRLALASCSCFSCETALSRSACAASCCCCSLAVCCFCWALDSLQMDGAKSDGRPHLSGACLEMCVQSLIKILIIDALSSCLGCCCPECARKQQTWEIILHHG